MKYLSLIFSLILSVSLAFLISRPIDSVPPLAGLLDPNHGFWQNTLSEDQIAEKEIDLNNLSAPVKVIYDEDLIPHVFAENELDLYRAQGYITAQHRLWQMEFQTHAAAGRISEIVGPAAIELDRMNRRKGLAFGAEKGLAGMSSEPEIEAILEAFSDGVNQYIDGLTDATLPVEYKILNYRPEHWTPYKSALLLKYMADMLMGDSDLQFSNLRKILGEEMVNKLFPYFPKDNDPVIEAERIWDFDPIQVQSPDTTVYPNDLLVMAPLPQPEPGIGSNNWAVSGSKTKSGRPILANDPHLSLNLPSIWYSMQLTTPNHSVKGATLPGAIGVISGFNENIAWGVTNATKDARDWYKITFKDESRTQYKYGDDWRDTEFRIEEIKVKGEDPFIDTVVYTHYGPVVYDKSFRSDRQDVNFALKWTAHEESQEVRTFILMNKAKNHDDYNDALDHYIAPPQNFVFAAKDGDIAMRIQGKFPVKWEGQGRFFMDGADPLMDWQAYIPNDQNASTLNPERGFVSSANQHPVDPSYPYFVWDRSYEHYRNRRLNNELRRMDDITIDDMKALQFDDYYLHAAEALPVILELLDEEKFNSEGAKKYIQELKSWDLYADPNQKAPTLFYIWWDKIDDQIWKEWYEWEALVTTPNNYQMVELLKNEPQGEIFDYKNTSETETAATHINAGFAEFLKTMSEWESEEGDYSWANYKRTSVRHLVPQFESFSVTNVYTGGGRGILNATSERHGASWRMVVELGETPNAYGIYPGGQSGNPGSRFYSNMINRWSKGEYIDFSLRGVDDTQDALFTTTFN